VLEEAAPDPLLSAIAAIDADALSPRDALDHIYRLKQLAADMQRD
jgi:DNA mismatch repair protein MutS